MRQLTVSVALLSTVALGSATWANAQTRHDVTQETWADVNAQLSLRGVMSGVVTAAQNDLRIRPQPFGVSSTQMINQGWVDARVTATRPTSADVGVTGNALKPIAGVGYVGLAAAGAVLSALTNVPKPVRDKLLARMGNVETGPMLGNVELYDPNESSRRPVLINGQPIRRTKDCLPGAICALPSVTAGNVLMIPAQTLQGPIFPVLINRGPVHSSLPDGDCARGVWTSGNAILVEPNDAAEVHATMINTGTVNGGIDCR